MTDKQIIIDTFNSAWNRKVATENSYGKLASKEMFENNNEDKQIIIDGVDVSKCEFYGETMKTHNCTLHYECLQSCKGTDCYYKNWQRKEQECEELKEEIKTNGFGCFNIEMFEQLDQLKRESEHPSSKEQEAKHCLEETEKFKNCLTKTKEVLQFYSNSTIGVDKGNGIFEFEISNDNVLGGKITCYYDTNPAKEALQKISECEGNNEV